ncbi:MAG: aminotransferase class III-fold pyridoxal phosphate-dependent enzyme [Nanoarchaeota archaeon]|nr:aminotransferase class III-fold pyridoxal phosphate-dependent enzyme [Nanoarchaeota archaeon]
MKAIIFVAGIGTRFKSLTDSPKCLLEIGDKLLITHFLDTLNELKIKDVILVVGYKKEEIKEKIGNSYKDIKIKYIDNDDYTKSSILSLLCTKDEFDDAILTLDGDVIFDKRILEKLIKSEDENYFLAEPDYLPKMGDEIVVVTDENNVVKTVDFNYDIKKQDGDMFWEGIGFMKWSKKDSSVFKKAFEDLLNQGIDEKGVYEKAIRYLIKNNLCQFKVISTENLSWTDIDYPPDLEKAEQIYSKLKSKDDLLFHPIKTEKIESNNRRIVSEYLPGSKSIKLIKQSAIYEPKTSLGQLPVGIAKAHGVNVQDVDGNIFLDGTSGVVVTNIGHSPEVINKNVEEQLKKFHHVYCFPYEKRVELAKKLVEIAPKNINRALLLTTGSETTEGAIKVARRYNQIKYGPEKRIIISFTGAFHGKTMGAQMAGGIEKLKTWIGHKDPGFIQIEFPNCYRCWKKREKYENCTEDCLDLLREKFKENPEKIAAVMSETFQGRDIVFPPPDFFKGVEKICKENNALFILDEVQAGAGRLGKMFGFENYDVKPNLVCLGKGISGGLPLSALLGESEILNCFGKGDMTTTHSANPTGVVATLASLDKLLENDEEVIKNCCKNEEIFRTGLNKLKEKYSCIGDVRGKGMIWGLDIIKDRITKEPDPELATKIHLNIYKSGVLLRVPRGPKKNIINVNPPLIMTEDCVKEILSVLEKSFEEEILG